MKNKIIRVHWIYKSVLTCFYAFLIYIGSSQDVSCISVPHYSDKIIHFIEFGILCILICWTFSYTKIVKSGICYIIAMTITSFYGGTDEIHQYFTPHRSVDIYDWIADTFGAVAGGFIWQFFIYKRQIKKPVVIENK